MDVQLIRAVFFNNNYLIRLPLGVVRRIIIPVRTVVTSYNTRNPFSVVSVLLLGYKKKKKNKIHK